MCCPLEAYKKSKAVAIAVIVFGWLNGGLAIAQLVCGIWLLGMGAYQENGFAVAFGVAFTVSGGIALTPSMFEVFGATKNPCCQCSPKCRGVLLSLAAACRILLLIANAGTLADAASRENDRYGRGAEPGEFVVPMFVIIFFTFNTLSDIMLASKACGPQDPPEGDVQMTSIETAKEPPV